jgi:hypothetical protein
MRKYICLSVCVSIILLIICHSYCADLKAREAMLERRLLHKRLLNEQNVSIAFDLLKSLIENPVEKTGDLELSLELLRNNVFMRYFKDEFKTFSEDNERRRKLLVKMLSQSKYKEHHVELTKLLLDDGLDYYEFQKLEKLPDGFDYKMLSEKLSSIKYLSLLTSQFAKTNTREQADTILSIYTKFKKFIGISSLFSLFSDAYPVVRYSENHFYLAKKMLELYIDMPESADLILASLIFDPGEKLMIGEHLFFYHREPRALDDPKYPVIALDVKAIPKIATASAAARKQVLELIKTYKSKLKDPDVIKRCEKLEKEWVP